MWTGDSRRPWADALVVNGAQLAFVGSAAEARKLVRDVPGVRVIDAGGQYVVSVDAGRTLRTGEPADFALTARDPSGPAPDATVATTPGAPPALVVRGGQVVDAC